MGAERAKIALSPTAAAALLPFGREDALRWMRERGLVRELVDRKTGAVRQLVIVSDLEHQIRLDCPSPIDRELGLVPEPEVPQRSRPKPKLPFIDPRTC